jgi:hypothetical protein
MLALQKFGIKSNRGRIPPLKELILIRVYSCTPRRNDTMRPCPDDNPFASSFAVVYVLCRSARDLKHPFSKQAQI